MSPKNSFRNGKKIASLAPSIIEDPLLEDMCAMGELEFDGDAENMTMRDKGWFSMISINGSGQTSE